MEPLTEAELQAMEGARCGAPCKEALQRAISEIRRLREALMEIKTDRGHVCEEFETCVHVACTDSHAAWEIADTALSGLPRGTG